MPAISVNHSCLPVIVLDGLQDLLQGCNNFCHKFDTGVLYYRQTMAFALMDFDWQRQSAKGVVKVTWNLMSISESFAAGFG